MLRRCPGRLGPTSGTYPLKQNRHTSRPLPEKENIPGPAGGRLEVPFDTTDPSPSRAGRERAGRPRAQVGGGRCDCWKGLLFDYWEMILCRVET